MYYCRVNSLSGKSVPSVSAEFAMFSSYVSITARLAESANLVQLKSFVLWFFLLYLLYTRFDRLQYGLRLLGCILIKLLRLFVFCLKCELFKARLCTLQTGNGLFNLR